MLEEKLRKEFIKALQTNKSEDVVDDLIGILKKDYVLVLKHPVYCRDCFNCNCSVGYGFTDLYNDAYCVFYQRRVHGGNRANGCEHFINGEEKARESIAVMHSELTGDLIYDR